jgi:tRNA1Val (adenine37-N6)-methyltransferase
MSSFSFKQFTIQQEHCAMKVCTDACLFGAWVAANIQQDESIQHILDIGAGTGLLSLMLAQKTNAHIDAIEINTAAAAQATENLAATPWKERLHLYQNNISDFNPAKKYDCIISNPPFFEDDLKSSNASKNAAKHDTTLTLESLLLQIKRLLKEEGTACVLIPFHRTDYFENLTKENGFFINNKLLVKQSINHGYFRSMLMFSKNKAANGTAGIYIHDAERQYGEAFTTLLKDFYLKL